MSNGIIGQLQSGLWRTSISLLWKARPAGANDPSIPSLPIGIYTATFDNGIFDTSIFDTLHDAATKLRITKSTART